MILLILIFLFFLLLPLSAFAVINDSIVYFTHDNASVQGTQSINNASTVSPKNFNGTMTAITTGATGDGSNLTNGQAFNFTKSSSSKVVFNNPTTPKTYGNLSFCASIYPSPDGLAGVWIAKEPVNGNFQVYHNAVRGIVVKGGTDTVIITTATIINDNNWQYVCVTVYDDNSPGNNAWATIYINGSNFSSGDINDLNSDLSAWHLGDTDGLDFLDGKMDNVGLWNKTLSAREVNATYHNITAGYSGPYFINNVTTASDTKSPFINASFLNDTSLGQNDGVNFTANISDNIGLSFCRFVINQTGVKQFFNKSITGTSDQCSQNFTIAVASGGVINFTAVVNDTSNNLNQSSQIITIGDLTAPKILNISLQRQPIMNTTQTNILTIKCEDSESNIDIMNFTLFYNNTRHSVKQIDITTQETTSNIFKSLTGGETNETTVTTTTQGKNYIWNYTIFASSETAKEGIWNITQIGCSDFSNNYAKNDSSNNLVGFDFLMDTPPTINSRSPTNGSTVTSTDTTGNAVITETNPSFMLVYHNITGIFHLNQTINYSGDGTTHNIFNLSGMTNGLNYVYALSMNTSFGTWTNTSNISFTVSVSSGGSSGGGGGGGGSSSTQVIINQTNVTLNVPNCNFNKICEGKNGEDPFGCPSDCKINTNYLFCDDPVQKCIANIFDTSNKTFRFIIALALGSAFFLGVSNIRKKGAT